MADKNHSEKKTGAAGNKAVKPEDELVNDSLGTVDPADSTGLDEDKQTGAPRPNSLPPRKD